MMNGTLPPDSVRSIANLPQLVDRLSPADQERFHRIVHVSQSVGELIPPRSMHDWIAKLFGSVAAVERQTIIKTTNLVTLEGTLFNALRASRPFESTMSSDVDTMLNEGVGDPFCTPR